MKVQMPQKLFNRFCNTYNKERCKFLYYLIKLKKKVRNKICNYWWRNYACSWLILVFRIFFILYFQLDALLFCLRTITAILLSSTCFRPHRPIISRSKLYMQPMVFCPSADVCLSQRPHDKDICRGAEYHRLHVQFRPPDDGPVKPETSRGKKIAVIVRKQKSSVSSWK